MGKFGMDYPDVPNVDPFAPGTLAELLAGLREWQHLPDPMHVIAALAAAATRHETGEATWLLMVAAPSSGKTEAVRLLDTAADARLDEITPAGLLGWSKGKSVKPSGVLARMGSRGLVTFGDLSTLLATSDRGGRDVVFGLLRRVYDGHVTRDISPQGKPAEGVPDRLEWSGRLTVVGCVTQAIDRYTAHADQLGARWLYIRLPERSTAEKRHAAALARRSALGERRAEARATVAALLAGVASPLPDLDEGTADVIEDAALVTAWGRASVPRNGYGRRDIEGVPIVEEPMRLVQQLSGVARGVLALGLPTQAAQAVARRIALDSMPEARRAVLEALSLGEPLNTSKVARTAGVDRKVARFQLEELAAIGVVTNDRVDDDEEEPTGPVTWILDGADGALIADVLSEHRRCGGWDEKWVPTPQTPQIREEGDDSTHGVPTFRPTPESGLPTDKSGTDSACPIHGREHAPDRCMTCEDLTGSTKETNR
ncbi:helix-turn-helix transcriptional regulator [Janibacter indicus]|uniref:Helix-turn-helix transcriptional regulator n=1 Tax=Janibacter indicus TaxID=857417 RepID=A0A7L9J4G0_9MICO|nr:helix-turn-helix transcriptional regulator [Janibacter indicus]QOK24142.1 helix-turn-helix transcriptional regulator [Janibacter indicus]